MSLGVRAGEKSRANQIRLLGLLSCLSSVSAPCPNGSSRPTLGTGGWAHARSASFYKVVQELNLSPDTTYPENQGKGVSIGVPYQLFVFLYQSTDSEVLQKIPVAIQSKWLRYSNTKSGYCFFSFFLSICNME